jgi:hypothetical protein
MDVEISLDFIIIIMTARSMEQGPGLSYLH